MPKFEVADIVPRFTEAARLHKGEARRAKHACILMSEQKKLDMHFIVREHCFALTRGDTTCSFALSEPSVSRVCQDAIKGSLRMLVILCVTDRRAPCYRTSKSQVFKALLALCRETALDTLCSAQWDQLQTSTNLLRFKHTNKLPVSLCSRGNTPGDTLWLSAEDT